MSMPVSDTAPDLDVSPAIDASRLRGIIDFIQAAEKLKDTLRSGATSQGRAESVAEHSWRLCLMAMLFGRELTDCDPLRLLKLCIVHDLGEAISGDVPAIHQAADDNRAERERSDLIALCAPLADDLRQDIIGLWDEYNAGATPEAVVAKGFDKLETMLQHVIGRNADTFDYAFNLDYGLAQTGQHPLLRQIRGLVDAATRARIKAPPEA
jgi:putative hydrolase of HD superfamily